MTLLYMCIKCKNIVSSAVMIMNCRLDNMLPYCINCAKEKRENEKK